MTAADVLRYHDDRSRMHAELDCKGVTESYDTVTGVTESSDTVVTVTQWELCAWSGFDVEAAGSSVVRYCFPFEGVE